MSIQIGSEKHLDLGASIVINKSEETIQADAFKSSIFFCTELKS